MEVAANSDQANEAGSVMNMKFEKAIGYKLIGDHAPCALSDMGYIGKHYMVKSTSHPSTKGTPSDIKEFDPSKTGIKRHYTEAFCMR